MFIQWIKDAVDHQYIIYKNAGYMRMESSRVKEFTSLGFVLVYFLSVYAVIILFIHYIFEIKSSVSLASREKEIERR